jgi:spermidine/putrescine transport system ATP-binding protein
VADFIGDTNFLAGVVQSFAKGRAQVKLTGGVVVDAMVPEGFTPSGKVTVVVRPEHAQLAAGGKGLKGVLENVVYFGTDTHFHVQLSDGGKFTVRQQNSRDGGLWLEPGSKVVVELETKAAQVLKD